MPRRAHAIFSLAVLPVTSASFADATRTCASLPSAATVEITFESPGPVRAQSSFSVRVDRFYVDGQTLTIQAE
jgi:hypothetical protein